jgi:hypothetical protein
LSWAVYRHVLLVAQNTGAPTSGDWSEYMNDVLVVGEGNKLTSTQRSDVEQLLKRTHGRNAVVSNSPVTRGVMTALAWLGLPVKAFAPTDLDGALAFLDVSSEHRLEARATLERLQRTLRIRRDGATLSG